LAGSAGLIATWVSDRIRASPITARDLLGCGVAAAVSASFNAPIAGTLFAETMYALAGMGAVAAAVLGAPISTTLIVFELTGNWETGLAVMVAVSLSVALASRIVDRSFFLTLLERRNIHLAAGPQAYLLQMFSVARVMTPKDADGAPPEEEIWERIEQGIYVDGNATLEAAMPIFEKSNLGYIPVVTLSGEGEAPELWGVIYQVDALKAYNRALAETAAEEHG